MNILEENQLIAGFMGYLQHNKLVVIDNIPIHIDNVKFSTLWDWIIPVVEKIKGLVCESEFIYRLGKHLLELDITEVYKACLKFIQDESTNINNQ